MKKLLFLILLVNIYSFCFPQNNIDGIGMFKIWETKTKVINQILEDNKVELENYNNIKQARWLKYRVDFLVAELFPNITDSDLNPLLTCFCPDVKIFFIKDYKIAGIYLLNVHLKFYKNTLIAFYCDSNDELLQALTTKYGNPKRLDNWDKVSGFSRIDDVKYYSLYWNNDPIFASFNYETNATGENNFYFIVRDTTYDKIIGDCETHRKEEYLNMEKDRVKANEAKKNIEVLDKL